MDSIRKVIFLLVQLRAFYDCSVWRQGFHNFKQIKRLFRKVKKIKHSTSKIAEVQEKQQALIKEACQAYLDLVTSFLERAEATLTTLSHDYGALEEETASIRGFIKHAERQIDQVQRRIIEGEEIPHDEKVFSIFQEHTEWIVKGKGGVPFELGLNVCFLEDQFGFILTHHVMEHQVDVDISVFMVQKAQINFPELDQCSFDKGFYSARIREELAGLLNFVILPKKGKLSEAEKSIEYSDEFIQARHQHSAVESAINALKVHGLDKCPDLGIDCFKKYVALAVLARNIQQLGAILQKEEQRCVKRKPAA